jgi:hypothetical protein
MTVPPAALAILPRRSFQARRKAEINDDRNHPANS